MRTILILPAGLFLIGIMLSGIFLEPNFPFLQGTDKDDEPNLTTAEAISIAAKEPNVSIFVRQTQAFVSTDYKMGLWSVRFTDIILNSNYIQVEIDDETQSIVDIATTTDSKYLGPQFINRGATGDNRFDQSSSMEDNARMASDQRFGLTEDYFYIGNQELVNAAIEYFSQNELVRDYINNNLIEFYGYSYDDTIYLWGYNSENYEEWMSATLFAEELTVDSWDFTILEISSASEFGDNKHSVFQAIELAKTTDEFKLFEENITQISMNSVLHYYGNVYEGKEGFIYNIYISSFTYFYGYEDQVVVDESGTSYETKGDSTNSQDVNSTEPIMYYGNDYNWIDVEISDNLWTVLEVWGPNSANLSLEKVIDITIKDPSIQDWMQNIEIISNYAYYSGYGFWWINIYDDLDPYNYAYITLSDRTGEVVEVFTFRSVPASMTEKNVNSIIQNEEGTKEFFDIADNYDSYLNYNRYGVWYFSFFDTENYYNYIWGSLNDTDGTMIYIEVGLYQEPNLNESEVFAALADSGINEFTKMYPDTSIYYYYNGYHTWYVSAYSVILVDAWFWAEVDDGSSEAVSHEEHHPKNLPTMNIDEILALAYTTTEFNELERKVSAYFEYYYFMDGTWYYYLQGTSDTSTYYWLSITIEDDSGEIAEIWSSSWDYSDDIYTDPNYTEKYGNETITAETS